MASTTCLARTATSKTLTLYKTNCAECHGENRLGMMGPALLPGNLKRLRQTNRAVYADALEEKYALEF